MTTISLADARASLDALIERVTGGDTITITHRGRAVARLTPVRDAPRKPVDLEALRALTAGMPAQGEGAGSLVRAMRDGDRY